MPVTNLAPAPVLPALAHRFAPFRSFRARCGGALSLLLTVLLLGACTDRAGPSPQGVGPSVAPDVVFRTLDGERLALRAAGGPTLVSFWSTSCTVCLAEMSDLARLHADYAPRGFDLVAVAMPHDRPDRVLELAEARELPFPVALDIDGRVLAAFEPVPGTPTSFLIDADGHVIERHVGRHDIEALRRRLDALVGEEPLVIAPQITPSAPSPVAPTRT